MKKGSGFVEIIEKVIEKGMFGAFAAIWLYLCNCLNEMFAILVVLMILDLITGVIAAFIRRAIKPWKVIVGLGKKFIMLVCYITAVLLDLTLFYVSKKTGQSEGFNPGVISASFVAICYLIGHEGLSIIENSSVAGFKIPAFIKKGFEKLTTTGK